MAIYRVVLNGTYQGQAVNNTLFYRTGIGVDVAGLAVGGAQDLANNVKSTIWPKMKECLPNEYTLENITAYPYADGTFDLMYQNPATVNVLETGVLADPTDGPAICAIIKYRLEPTTIVGNGPKPPKRGYIALGPIPSAWINNSGQIDGILFTDPMSKLNQFADALGANLTSILPPVVWFPIRVHQDKVLGILRITSFADVSGATCRRRTSFRRSRMIEN